MSDFDKQKALGEFIDRHIFLEQTMLIEHLISNGVSGFDLFEDVENFRIGDTEIFEWWIVSSWLANRLKELDEPILKNDYGIWWGRTSTGQAIKLDGVIEEIYDGVV